MIVSVKAISGVAVPICVRIHPAVENTFQPVEGPVTMVRGRRFAVISSVPGSVGRLIVMAMMSAVIVTVDATVMILATVGTK